MTDKEYMLQILRIDDRIDSIKRDIDAQIDRKADTLSATDYSKDRISGGSCSDLSGIVAGIEQCVEQQRKEIERLKSIKAEVRWVISQVRPNELAVLLTERYVQGRSWKDLANILYYSEARVRGELHDRALAEVGNIRNRLKKR
ncbi:MAG: hypothetical protein E7D17_08395 [Citrobacter freundii]|jgi:hypothetical protein|uniref:DUF1492 domain-containing protein n=1 Tax=Caudovirales sp. cts2v4 TaxID=2825773 RepID=A0A8S5PNI0_9CAUD|nr:hypothetical protein [Citrobacter freundii]DAE08077.1 MAG TPA: Protein of unknown function (DUF1492) [Caudovirales sp. cts2v4]DAT20912.1 MAG TPA: Protein of unknown function (DUF1492) [Caudoviricetes sp.]